MFDPVVYPVHGQQEQVMAVPNPMMIGQGPPTPQWDDANVERVKEDLMNEIAHLEQLEKKRNSLTNAGTQNKSGEEEEQSDQCW